MGKWPEFLEQVEKRLLEKGLRAAAASRRAVGNPFFIYNLRKGHKPNVENLERLCAVLELDYAIGGAAEKSATSPPGFYAFEDGEEAEPELALACDQRIEEVLATLADHYKRNNAYGRRYFIEEVKTHWPVLFQVEDAAESAPRRVRRGGSAGAGGAKER